MRERPGKGTGLEGDGEEETERSQLLRPSRRKVEDWLEWWPKRWALLVLVPSVIIWCWAAVPFPVSDPYDSNPHWDWPPAWNRTLVTSSSTLNDTLPPNRDADLPVDAK